MPTQWWGNLLVLEGESRETETPQGRLGRGSPVPLLTRREGTRPSTWLCLPSVPQETAAPPVTSWNLAWLSGTGTPVWHCRLRDREVRTLLMEEQKRGLEVDLDRHTQLVFDKCKSTSVEGEVFSISST